MEKLLAAQPPIPVPAIVLQGEDNGVVPEMWSSHRHRFTGRAEQWVLPRIGHNIPAEAPGAVADAVLELIRATS